MKATKLCFPLLLLGLISIFNQSCTKDDVTVIDGNQAPPDNTIENLVYQNYVNKAYIALLGHEPDDVEREQALNILYQGSLSMGSRDSMLQLVIADNDFYTNAYQQAGEQLINGYDTLAIAQYEAAYQLVLLDTAYQSVWYLVHLELDKLTLLREVPEDLYNGTLSIKDMHRRMINNRVYDEINMGTENFVLTVFDHFFLRLPTVSELEESKNMVDGLNAIVFFQEGYTKDMFMDHFFDHQEYYEGQVRQLYQKYLFREPTLDEVTELSSAYMTTGDYKALLIDILSTDEYVGLE